jgi:hypothetical protein
MIEHVSNILLSHCELYKFPCATGVPPHATREHAATPLRFLTYRGFRPALKMEKTMPRFWLASAAARVLTAGAAQAQDVFPRTAIVAQPAPPTVVVVPAPAPPPAFVAVAPPAPIVVPAPLPVDVPPGAVAVTKTQRTIDANGVQTDKVQTYERTESYGAGNGALTTTTTTNSSGQAVVTVPGTTTTTTQTTTTRYQ